MSNTRKSLRERTKEFSSILPFMDGREKGELDRIKNTPVTIVDYGFLKDSDDSGEEKEYVCFIVKEDEQHFYFGGQVLTDNMKQLDEEGYGDEIRAEGLPVELSERKSKNKRTYTSVVFYPEPAPTKK